MSRQLWIISVDYTRVLSPSSSSQVAKTRKLRVACNFNLFSNFLLIALKEDICKLISHALYLKIAMALSETQKQLQC